MKSTSARVKRLLLRPVSRWVHFQPNVPPIEIPALDKGLQLSAKVRDALDASGQRVVLLARSGQNLESYGMHYSHMGFAFLDTQGIWRVVHKLNDYESNRGEVYLQSIGEFFLDEPWMYRGGWASLPESIQDQLLAVLQDKHKPVALHLTRYSILSYPWSTKFQQSNQWVMETFALALNPDTIHTREDAQAWIQQKPFTPTVIQLSKLKRIAARFIRANIAFSDHPEEKRKKNTFEMVSADSVFHWMKQYYGASDVHVVQL